MKIFYKPVVNLVKKNIFPCFCLVDYNKTNVLICFFKGRSFMPWQHLGDTLLVSVFCFSCRCFRGWSASCLDVFPSPAQNKLGIQFPGWVTGPPLLGFEPPSPCESSARTAWPRRPPFHLIPRLYCLHFITISNDNLNVLPEIPGTAMTNGVWWSSMSGTRFDPAIFKSELTEKPCLYRFSQRTSREKYK